MVWTDEEFREEAIVFLNKEWRFFNENRPFDIESLALKYVKNNSKFKYKDHVEAGVLVTCLVKFEYIEFTNKENDIRYHSLTKKGIDFIEDKKKSRK